ncbi:MAG: LysR family transcriptional regulator [Myxococcota bacterium]
MQGLIGLDLNLLLALEMLLEEGSVTGAARRLGVTQPAVSHKLRRLREALNDELFVAGPRGLVPTERARAIAGPLRQALEQLVTTLADEEPFDPRHSEYEYVVTGADLFELVGLPYVLDFVAEEAPGITVTVVRRRVDMYQRMERGEIHFAFGHEFPSRAGLRQVKLFDEPFVVMGRPEHPAFRGPLTLEKYLAADHVLVAPEGAPGGFVDDALEKQGLTRRVAVRVAHFAPAPHLVARRDLLLTGPESLGIESAKTLPIELRPVPIELPRTPSYLGWHERFERDPAHRWFRQQTQRFTKQRWL